MRRLSLPRPHPPSRAVVGALLVAALLLPGWLWLRSSPLVAVSEVTVTGATGPQAAQIRRALEDAARRMTTLDVDRAALRAAVRPFPVVAEVRADARPPRRLELTVREYVPVAALASGSRRAAVAADGTIIEGTLTRGLPVVPGGLPAGRRLPGDGRARRMVALLAAAPVQLRARIARVTAAQQGLVVQLRNGPAVYFGAPARLRAKWAAATRVLADYSSRGATYLDVRVPERPAAGGLEPSDPQPEVQPSG